MNIDLVAKKDASELKNYKKLFGLKISAKKDPLQKN